MPQIPLSTVLERSRLVSLLTDLSASKLSSAEYNLAERLGHLVGLSGSITLANGLRKLPYEAGRSLLDDAAVLHGEVLDSRERMINVIASSFNAEADIHIKVPSATGGLRPEALQTYEPYQRFYTAHQVEMAVGVSNLRARVRAVMSGFCVELHQLAELDKTLDESLAVHTRKLFNVIPKLLEQRFKSLLQAHRQDMNGNVDNDLENWLDSGGWLDLFYRDMRELLLAEFDVRLQPVLGLLEALNEQTDTSE